MPATFQGLTFERLGHASVRIETEDGTVIYIDPWSGAIDATPRDGDVVFVTHDDSDHYDPDAIEAVAGPEASVAIYEAVDTSDLDRDIVELPYSGTAEVGGIFVETIPAHNDPTGEHVNEDGEPFHAEREVVGLILTIDDVRVYYPSDTDFLEIHEAIEADVFIPPIGGHYTMDRWEAAAFARAIEPALVLPVHYGTFQAIETDVDAFIEALADDGIRAERF